MSASFTRAQRRRFNAVADQAEKMVEADARFFHRFPNRSHRVRPASHAEMEANRLANGLKALPTGPGQRWYCAVKKIAPGVRSRVFLQNDADTDTDLSEWQAQYVYDLIARPGSQALRIEELLRAAIAKRGVR